MSTRSLRRPRQSSSSQPQEVPPHTEKENASKGNISVSKLKASTSKTPKVHCSCSLPDDGSPMIHCSECKEWYHFKCVQLDTRDAEDIQVYVCAPCTDKTGLRTVSEYRSSVCTDIFLFVRVWPLSSHVHPPMSCCMHRKPGVWPPSVVSSCRQSLVVDPVLFNVCTGRDT
ncbi:hypothetical protein BC835DRAFT_1314819 [Cytidiella melzeri]|nr:hypothetical protein BC835DRAFT_1314819 [Cytidiella melzeri]